MYSWALRADICQALRANICQAVRANFYGVEAPPSDRLGRIEDSGAQGVLGVFGPRSLMDRSMCVTASNFA